MQGQRDAPHAPRARPPRELGPARDALRLRHVRLLHLLQDRRLQRDLQVKYHLLYSVKHIDIDKLEQIDTDIFIDLGLSYSTMYDRYHSWSS